MVIVEKSFPRGGATPKENKQKEGEENIVSNINSKIPCALKVNYIFRFLEHYKQKSKNRRKNLRMVNSMPAQKKKVSRYSLCPLNCSITILYKMA